MSDHPVPTTRLPVRRRIAGLAAAGLIAVGAAAGAVAVEASRPSVTMAPATPVAIRSLGDNGIVTIRGQVAEIFGNKFVMADATGRALVDTGREGEGGTLVHPGEAVTVQGRFDRGFIHAAFLVSPGGKVVALGPLAGPHEHRGPHDGPAEREPGHDAPPPPPPAPVAAPGLAATPAPAAGAPAAK